MTRSRLTRTRRPGWVSASRRSRPRSPGSSPPPCWGSAWLSSSFAGADREPGSAVEHHHRRTVRPGKDVEEERLERQSGLRVDRDRLRGLENASKDFDDPGEIEVLGPSLQGRYS